MPNQYVRLNLASAIFPFYTQAAGRTIIIPGNDENFDRYNAANTTPDKGVPQVFYMHNVVPITGGFQSVGYNKAISGLLGAQTDFDNCLPLTYGSTTFFFSPAAGVNYIYDGNVGNWASISPLATNSVPTNVLVTTAYIQGVTYIYYANVGCFSYNSTTKLMTSVTLTGLTAANVLGICASNGYMIAWTSNTVAWSSLTDPTNFIPSVQTGAGGGSVQDAKGPITCCISLAGGFLIYCQKNIVGATYTANTSFPYILSEVKGSGGVSSIDSIAYQGNLPYQVALTTAGLQQVSVDSAIPTMPELSDFLTAQLFEDFDEIALAFTQSYLTSQLSVKLASVSNRFIVISYGISPPDYTHAIIFDMELNRYGKLKLPHRTAFSYIAPQPYGLVTYNQLMNTPINQLGNNTYLSLFTTMVTSIVPKGNLAFLQSDGSIQLVDFELSEVVASGVFIIGKFQYSRGNVIIHQKADVETLNLSTNCSLYLLPTFDGKDFGPAVPTTQIATGALTRTYAKRYTASNISLCLVGAFNLSSIVLNFTIGGSR